MTFGSRGNPISHLSLTTDIQYQRCITQFELSEMTLDEFGMSLEFRATHAQIKIMQQFGRFMSAAYDVCAFIIHIFTRLHFSTSFMSMSLTTNNRKIRSTNLWKTSWLKFEWHSQHQSRLQSNTQQEQQKNVV